MQKLSIPLLTNFCFDENVDMISSACNLIYSTILSDMHHHYIKLEHLGLFE